MSIVQELRQAAAVTNATVVLPEGTDVRTIDAAVQLQHAQIVHPILLGDVDAVRRVADDASIDLPDTLEIIDPARAPNAAAYADVYYALRKEKGISRAEAREQVNNPLLFGALMVREGHADGCVAGAVNATSSVLRAALQIIGMKPGVQIASSVFLMVLPDGRALTYGDCGMVPDPDAAQLAQIAVASAQTHQQLTGETPIVAMLSFSTKGSASHASVTKVQEATALAQRMAPNSQIDGELQFDAAFVEAIGQRKAPDSAVAGRANVFIFPNLDAGNIAYKITERLGGAQAFGPIIQGLAKPMHDLSRGCKAEDIVTLSAICAVQAKS